MRRPHGSTLTDCGMAAVLFAFAVAVIVVGAWAVVR